MHQRPFEKTFNSLFEDLFQNIPSTYMKNDWNAAFSNGFVPVNIRETAEAYEVEVVAPGMDKSEFKVNIENNLLTISGEKKTENKEETERQVKREFSFRAFSRSFTLDDTIDSSRIAAKYENGILHLTLPKKEEVKIVPKEISIQ